jgi:hypothetical protein
MAFLSCVTGKKYNHVVVVLVRNPVARVCYAAWGAGRRFGACQLLRLFISVVFSRRPVSSRKTLAEEALSPVFPIAFEKQIAPRVCAELYICEEVFKQIEISSFQASANLSLQKPVSQSLPPQYPVSFFLFSFCNRYA